MSDIVLIFTLIGTFLSTSLVYPESLSLRPQLNPKNPALEKRGKKLSNHESMKKRKVRQGLNPEFRYYIRDEEGNLLKEPCGFPGHWTVEVNIQRLTTTDAAIERMVKSFSLSMHTAGRSDIQRAKFTVVDKLPKEKTVLVKEEDFYIKRSDIFGLEIVVNSSFLSRGISEQRNIFAKTSEKIPKDIDINKRKSVRKKAETKKKLEKVLIFNNPIILQGNIRGYSNLNTSSLALATLLKNAGYNAEIDNHCFNILTPRAYKNKIVRKYIELRLRRILKDVDMVSFSVYDEHLPYIQRFTELIRNVRPDIIIALGGHLLTVAPEHAVAQLPYVNIFYRGEAEAEFLNILESIKKLDSDNSSAESVFNAFQGNHGTMSRFYNIYQFSDLIHVNRMTPEEFNNREFDFSFIGEKNTKGAFSFMTSLGCPFNCGFCATAGGSKPMAMESKRVIGLLKAYEARLEELIKNGASIPLNRALNAWDISTNDDDLLQNQERVLEILKSWKDEKLKVRNTGIQTTLQSFLTRDTDGRLKVDTALIDKIAFFKESLPRYFCIEIGTDALFNNEIKRLGKPLYKEDIIEEAIAAFEKHDIYNKHNIILTNPETRLEDLVKTCLRASVLEAKYKHMLFSLVNPAIIPHIGTPVVNKLIEDNKAHLIRGPSIGVVDYDEYDCYWGANTIFSEYIPEDLNYAIRSYDFQKGSPIGLLEYLLGKIDEALDSVDKKRDWDYYKGLLGENVKKEIARFYKVKNSLPLKYESSFYSVVHNFISIERKLKELSKLFKEDALNRGVSDLFSNDEARVRN